MAEPIESILARLRQDLDTELDSDAVLRLRIAVLADIATPARQPSDRWRRIATVVTIAAVVIAGLLVASSGARRAVARILGVRGVRIERIPTTTAPTTSVTTATTNAPTGPPATVSTTGEPTTVAISDGLQLGRDATPEQAAAALGVAARFLPDSAGRPTRIAITTSGIVTVVYAPGTTLPATAVDGVGALLSQFRGSVDRQLFRKIAGPDTIVEPITVGGHDGLWVSGPDHQVAYTAPDGKFVVDSNRLSANTLLWENGAVTFRLETSLAKADAIALAETIA